MRICFLLLLPLFLLQACASDTSGPAPETAAFFDLRNYVNGEVDRLTNNKVRVTKTISLNGEVETRTLDELNFSNDLRVFREADINKPAWIEKYSAEVDKLSGSHRITTYTSLDSNLITRKLIIEEDQGAVIRIGIERKTGTVLSDGIHQLEYLPASGYSMLTKQDNRFGKDVDASIKVSW